MLGGLVENFTLGQLLDYFLDEAKRKSIFSPTTSVGDKVLRAVTGLGPKYSTQGKLSALRNLLPNRGNTPLREAVAGIRRPGADADVHLMISAFDYDRNRATFFRSAVASGPQWGEGDTTAAPLAEVVAASANAPLNYFDLPAYVDTPGAFPNGQYRYWDGAIAGCNNPILAAVAEAIVLGQKATNIVALSLGSANVALPWPSQLDPPGSPHSANPYGRGPADLRKLAGSILDDPPDIATFLAHVMTGETTADLPSGVPSRIVRMNPLVSPMGEAGAWRAPGVPAPAMTEDRFKYLANLDMDAIEQNQVQVISDFADLWTTGNVTNQPIRMHADTLRPEVGAGSYAGAVEAWQLLKAL